MPTWESLLFRRRSGPKVRLQSVVPWRPAGVEFIDENGGGPGVRLQSLEEKSSANKLVRCMTAGRNHRAPEFADDRRRRPPSMVERFMW
jgi:hypothetical protein